MFSLFYFPNIIVSFISYHFDGTARKFFEGWYFKVSIPECRQSFCFMYSVESPAFTNKLSPLEVAQYGPRFTGVGAQILGADDKYICQYTQNSQNFWGSMLLRYIVKTLYYLLTYVFYRRKLYETCLLDLVHQCGFYFVILEKNQMCLRQQDKCLIKPQFKKQKANFKFDTLSCFHNMDITYASECWKHTGVYIQIFPGRPWLSFKAMFTLVKLIQLLTN